VVGVIVNLRMVTTVLTSTTCDLRSSRRADWGLECKCKARCRKGVDCFKVMK
jgi:hypothetical protein